MKNKKRRTKYEKWLTRSSIPRWWFAGLNIPSLVSSYREREERGRERENGARRIETVIRARIHTFIRQSENGGEYERGRRRRRRSSRRREGRRRVRLRSGKEREEVELCYYRAPPWRTAQYGAISDFHPPKSRIYARASARSSWPAEGWSLSRLSSSSPSPTFLPSSSFDGGVDVALGGVVACPLHSRS